jgi:hypothetical protein
VVYFVTSTRLANGHVATESTGYDRRRDAQWTGRQDGFPARDAREDRRV